MNSVLYYFSRVARKSAFGVSDQVRHKPGCTATEDDQRLEIPDLGSRGVVHVLSIKQKQRRLSAVQLLRSGSASLFSHMQKRFSHDTAQF